jgi:hypothetical protein
MHLKEVITKKPAIFGVSLNLASFFVITFLGVFCPKGKFVFLKPA